VTKLNRCELILRAPSRVWTRLSPSPRTRSCVIPQFSASRSRLSCAGNSSRRISKSSTTPCAPRPGPASARHSGTGSSTTIRSGLTGPLISPSNCRCSMCRKQHGAAFRSRARVQMSNFKWIQGEDLVISYESSPGSYRGFCRVCGSPIINKFDARSWTAQHDPDVPSRYGIALAALDDDPGVRPLAHSFVASKAP